MNSLRNKIVDLREIILKLSLDYLVLSETKIDQSFPTAQFYIKGFEVRARRDRGKHGGRLIEFVKNGFTSKRLKEYETKKSGSICSEFTIANRKWICLNIYRPPNPNNMNTFFDEITASLSKATMKCENIIIMGDFNIDIKHEGLGYGKLDTFCDIFNLTNLIHSETCSMKNHKSTIDLFLTNKPKSFFKTHTTEKGLTDYHKRISKFFKSKAPRLRPKVIFYRNYKKFDEKSFLDDLQNKTFSKSANDPNVNYKSITENFSETIDKHAPLKRKFIRGSHAPFMNRDFQKARYTRTRLKNKRWRDLSRENELAYKKQRNPCVSIRRKSIANYLNNFSDKSLETNKSFWKFIKPFLTNCRW